MKITEDGFVILFVAPYHDKALRNAHEEVMMAQIARDGGARR
jgi:hypothetical protein